MQLLPRRFYQTSIASSVLPSTIGKIQTFKFKEYVGAFNIFTHRTLYKYRWSRFLSASSITSNYGKKINTGIVASSLYCIESLLHRFFVANLHIPSFLHIQVKKGSSVLKIEFQGLPVSRSICAEKSEYRLKYDDDFGNDNKKLREGERTGPRNM